MSKQRSPIVTGPITALSPKGTGVLQTPDGPVYVPHTTPGDRVSVQIIKYAATYRIGKLKTIHLPSTDRRTPHCPLSGRCGGCQLGHIEPIQQREFKMNWLRDWLNKNQLTPMVSDIRFNSEVGYRNKLQLSIVKDHTVTRLGLNRFHSLVVEPVSSCPVVTPEINQLIDPVREWVSQLDQTPSQVTIRSSNTGQSFAITGLDGPHWGDSELVESINGIHYRVSPNSFFQGNRTLAKQMIDTVIDFVSPTETTTGLDLFGGVGLFGLPLAKRSRHVIGVESSSSSSADAAHNAAANGILNYTATCADTDAIWPLPLRPDYSVVDPPRTGIPTKTLNELCHSKIPKLVYVSCNPSTFATDAGHLSNQYELINVVPFDMFPNTIHMEVIGVFRCRPF